MRLAFLWEEARRRGLPGDGALLIVNIDEQHIHLLFGGGEEARFIISTSRNGTGNMLDSYQTPTGWHEIVERYGDREPAGRVFFEREPTDEILPEAEWSTDRNNDLIMTRILRLAGLEDGINRGGEVDTYERYVYLHAANHEHMLGKPASNGCIHLGNRDIMELFDRVAGVTTWCWIGCLTANEQFTSLLNERKFPLREHDTTIT